jgi:hypothetical protein
MSGATQAIDFTEPQKIAANLLASTFCNGGTEAFLDAQADMLKGVETAMAEWLNRRREAVLDAQRLVTRMRESRDVTAIWQAQQEWAAGALQRLAADVATYPALFAKPANQAVEQTRAMVSETAQRVAELPKAVIGRAAKAVAAEAPKPATAEEAHAR